jgi:hypothetical protein
VGFVSDSVYLLDYIYLFVYIEPLLHLWNETNIIMVYDLLNMFLNSVCKDFLEKFCINVHQRNWTKLFLCVGPYSLWISG